MGEPKQFLKINGKPMLAWTVDAFQRTIGRNAPDPIGHGDPDRRRRIFRYDDHQIRLARLEQIESSGLIRLVDLETGRAT